MKKKLLLFFITILSINCYAQITFEQGYYINNENQKIKCLIKNIDWKNTPNEFTFKLTKNSKSQKAKIKSVKEFEIRNDSKYIRKTIEIDRSQHKDLNKLDYNINPNFQTEQLFLKVLVEGKANLYVYKDGNLIRYFYNNATDEIKQLIFKYFKTADNKLGKNQRFKQQLQKDLTCLDMKSNKVKSLTYDKKSLVNYFIAYNQCSNSDFKNYENKGKRKFFRLSIRPRINLSSLTINKSNSTSLTTDFGSEVQFRFGLEGEFILPFNKNKWSVLIEPTYQSFKAEKKRETDNLSIGRLTANVNYSSIEIPIGLRHYFFLNNRSNFFANMAFIFDYAKSSSITFEKEYNSKVEGLKINLGNNFAFGVGFKLDDKFSVELRYHTNKDVLKNYFYWFSSYKTTSIILGYRIL